MDGETSPTFRRVLFSSFVYPLFSWMFPIFPLFSATQRDELGHFYYTCVKRVLHCTEWDDCFFAFALDEITLADRCARYWDRYLIHLADSTDGSLLLEKASYNASRQAWLGNEFPIKGLHRSKRFAANESIINKVLSWTASLPAQSSVPIFDSEDVETLGAFPESFLRSYRRWKLPLSAHCVRRTLSK